MIYSDGSSSRGFVLSMSDGIFAEWTRAETATALGHSVACSFTASDPGHPVGSTLVC